MLYQFFSDQHRVACKSLNMNMSLKNCFYRSMDARNSKTASSMLSHCFHSQEEEKIIFVIFIPFLSLMR